MTMMQSIQSKRFGILGAVALLVSVLMFATPIAATPTSPTPIPPGPIIITSTSGQYWQLSGPTTHSGTAAGTMTLMPIVPVAAVYNYQITTGSLSIGKVTYSITGGAAQVNQHFISGAGTVQGGTFTFTVFGVSATALGPSPLSILVMHLHVGGNYYLVLLHVNVLAPASGA